MCPYRHVTGRHFRRRPDGSWGLRGAGSGGAVWVGAWFADVEVLGVEAMFAVHPKKNGVGACVVGAAVTTTQTSFFVAGCSVEVPSSR